MFRSLGFRVYFNPKEPTFLRPSFIETMIRKPQKVGLFGLQVGFRVQGSLSFPLSISLSFRLSFFSVYASVHVLLLCQYEVCTYAIALHSMCL